MIQRQITSIIHPLRKQYPVITLTGARQTGKTTLLKSLYNDLPYVNLEDIDNRTLAKEDPRTFLNNYSDGAVLDEVQQAPQLFSYIQQIVDEKEVHFALSGSQNFQLLENITQSLAGRTAILTLMPFSYKELTDAGFAFENYESLVFKGGYPRLYDRDMDIVRYYQNYITTYVERDVRLIKNIENLTTFVRFIKLCAGRIGQLVNLQSLANDTGISTNTVKSWLSVLEASYIIYQHQPYYKNFNKRIIKSPKIYFYDTGLACSLLQIKSAEQLSSHYLIGGLFENFVLNEMHKFYANKGLKPSLSYWQSKEKKEIDVIIDEGTSLLTFEIKAARTKSSHFFDNLQYWQKLAGTDNNLLNVIYGGDENFKTSKGNYISWRGIDEVIGWWGGNRIDNISFHL